MKEKKTPKLCNISSLQEKLAKESHRCGCLREKRYTAAVKVTSGHGRCLVLSIPLLQAVSLYFVFCRDFLSLMLMKVTFFAKRFVSTMPLSFWVKVENGTKNTKHVFSVIVTMSLLVIEFQSKVKRQTV